MARELRWQESKGKRAEGRRENGGDATAYL
jgi:hypothetical protein